MTYDEWLAAHLQTWGALPSPGEAWAFAERQALERALDAVHNAHPTPLHAMDAIRAMMQDASSVASKEGN